MKAFVTEQNGVRQISIDGKLYPPYSFRSFRPEERNISEFYGAGVRLMSILMTGIECTLQVPYSLYGEIWTGKGQYDFAAIDRQMELFLRCAPDAYFNIMLQLDTRDWYLKEHPEFSNTFHNLIEMAGCREWREDVCEYLRDVIGYLEEKYGDRIFSYSMFCGGSTEWYTNSQCAWCEDGKIRKFPLKQEAFRRYTGDAEIELPDMEELSHCENGVFRDPQADARAVKYWHFHHDEIADTICWFARYIKNELLHREKLLGLYFGYIWPLPGTRLLYEGQLSGEKVLESPDIDIIYAPASYQDRGFAGVSGYLNNVDSVLLHGKMQWHEVDHTTYIAPSVLENGREIPGGDLRLKDAFQSRMLLRREFSMCAAKRNAMWWFDFFGGYYYAPELMEEVAMLHRVGTRLSGIPMRSVSEIAVLTDSESMLYVSEFAKINDDCLTNLYDSIGRLGAPFDLYNFRDLDRLDVSQYKFFLVPNAFLISPEMRETVKRKLYGAGKTVFWIYAPGYLDGEGFSEKAMSETAGMTIRRIDQKGSKILWQGGAFGVSGEVFPVFAVDDPERARKRVGTGAVWCRGEDCVPEGAKVLWKDGEFGFQEEISPVFAVEDPDAEVFGRYAGSGKAALARKKTENGVSWYCGAGNVPWKILRRAAADAGVHIYCDGDDPVYGNDRLIGIHAGRGGTVTLRLGKDAVLEDLFDGGSVRTEHGDAVLEIPEGTMKLYLISQKEA